ncbi:MAG: VCBS repeat-containing protein, partial [Gammaproteobacteria bacterium]|nr:VCBS repeat-containing protein [Gammaproteobacteria bacterium]
MRPRPDFRRAARWGGSMVVMASLLLHPNAPGAMRIRPQEFSVGPNPSAIVAVDINGDGLPEIITADRGELSDLREERPANDELSLLIAKGDLKYEKHHPSLKTDFGPYAIAVANIDAHKWPDILVGNFHAARHQ